MAWDLGDHSNQRNITQTRETFPVMWQFSAENGADNCAPVRWSSVLLKDESRVESRHFVAITTTGTYSSTHFTISWETRGRPVLLTLHRQPVSRNWRNHSKMLWWPGADFPNLRTNERWALVTDEHFAYSNKKILLLHCHHFVEYRQGPAI